MLWNFAKINQYVCAEVGFKFKLRLCLQWNIKAWILFVKGIIILISPYLSEPHFLSLGQPYQILVYLLKVLYLKSQEHYKLFRGYWDSPLDTLAHSAPHQGLSTLVA